MNYTHHNGFAVRRIPSLTKKQITRFWNNVHIMDNTNECWCWNASISFGGYGQVSLCGQNWKAPRIAYYLHYGIDPLDKMILHSCDNRLCCNPYHLRTGNCKENMQDAIIRGRHVACKTGKVLPPDEREIVRMLHRQKVPMKTIALSFGISETTVRNICHE